MHKKLFLPVILSLFIWVTLYSSCSNNSKEELLNLSVCDTTAVKFSTTIMPIFTASCNSQTGCHGSVGQGSVLLESYDNIMDNTSTTAILTYIKASANWMPKNNPKLDDCSINKIQAWVNQGALNN
jgi:hypothetical protein